MRSAQTTYDMPTGMQTVKIFGGDGAETVIDLIQVFSSQTVAAGGTALSAVVDLSDYRPLGFFSLQIKVTGDGTVKFEAFCSNDGSTYCGPLVCKSDGTTTTIATGITSSGGQNGNGNGLYAFSPPVAKFMKIKASETGTSDAVVVSAWLAIQ